MGSLNTLRNVIRSPALAKFWGLLGFVVLILGIFSKNIIQGVYFDGEEDAFAELRFSIMLMISNDFVVIHSIFLYGIPSDRTPNWDLSTTQYPFAYIPVCILSMLLPNLMSMMILVDSEYFTYKYDIYSVIFFLCFSFDVFCLQILVLPKFDSVCSLFFPASLGVLVGQSLVFVFFHLKNPVAKYLFSLLCAVLFASWWKVHRWIHTEIKGDDDCEDIQQSRTEKGGSC